MIRRWENMRPEELERAAGGNGILRLFHVLEEEEMHGAGKFFGVTIIPPGGSAGRHTHTGEFETYFIIRGKARVDDNGTYYELHPYDMIQCKDGCFHAIENIGEEDLEYLAVKLYTK